MLKSVTAGRFLTVQPSGASYISTNHNTVGTGMTRFNPSTQSLEVYDGYSWLSVTGSSHIALTDEAVELLEWAKQERDRQQYYEQLAKKYVTVADAIESVKDAEHRLRELAILCETSETR